MTRTRPTLPLLVAIPLLAGGALLGVLMVGWVNEASAAEEARARAALALGTTRVRMEAEEEVRIIASLMRVEEDDLGEEDRRLLAEYADFWYTGARYPGVVREIWIARGSPVREAWVYDPSAALFVARDPPDDLEQILAAPQGEAPTPGPILPDGDAVVLLRGREEAPTTVLVLDTEVLYGVVIPALMEEHLGGFPYRVSVDGVPVHTSGSVEGREPESVTGLDTLIPTRLGPFEPPDTAEARAEGIGRIRDDPSLRFWMLSGRLSRERPPGENGRDSRATLEVYYPHRSLDSTIRGRRMLSIGLGVGILAILTASAAILWALYRRSMRLRASEQEFVASLSHELRTPISVIQATSDNLAGRRGHGPGAPGALREGDPRAGPQALRHGGEHPLLLRAAGGDRP